MSSDEEHDAMADACIKAAELVKDVGSPALQTTMHVLLYTLGREIAERIDAGSKEVPSRPGGDGHD